MKTMKHFFYLALLMFGSFTYAQVGIGTNTPNHALEIESTDSGLVIPRVASTAAVTVAPINGTMIYDETDNCVKAYEAGAWSDCFSAGGGTVGTPTRIENGRSISNSDLDGVVLVTGGSGSFNLDDITAEVDGSSIVFANFNSFTGFGIAGSNITSGSTVSTANPAAFLTCIYDLETDSWYITNR